MKYEYYVQPLNSKEAIKVSRKQLINEYLNKWCLKVGGFINDALGHITMTDEKKVNSVLYAITKGNCKCYILCGYGSVYSKRVGE